MNDLKNIMYILVVTFITVQSLMKIGVTEYKRKSAGKCLEGLKGKFDIKGIVQLGIYYLFSQGLINVLAKSETPEKMAIATLYINVIMTVIAVVTVYFSMMNKGVYENGVSGDYGIIFWDEIKDWEVVRPKRGGDWTIKVNSQKNHIVKRIKIKGSKHNIAKMEEIFRKKAIS